MSWARLFFMFGDGEPPTKYVRHLMESLLAGKRVTCRFPDVIRDYLAVEEVASALRILLESPVEGAINIGSGEAVSVGTLTRFIGELAKRPDLIDYGEIVDLNEPTYIVADTTKLLGNVGWKPQVSNAEYLRTFFKRLAD